jgi:hypothetical protein
MNGEFMSVSITGNMLDKNDELKSVKSDIQINTNDIKVNVGEPSIQES